MASGGLNQFVNLTVPVNQGDGPAIDISTLVAKKTLYISGSFRGTYTILGSHDNIRYVPIAQFQSSQGPQPIKRDINAALRYLKVRRQADNAVTINVASQQVCSC